jgi:thiol-disulfide isomerase/thioredoxin
MCTSFCVIFTAQRPTGTFARKARPVSLALLLAAIALHPLRAAPPPAAGFQTLVEKHQKETMQAVQKYLAENPDADDADQASLWLLESASQWGHESEVVSEAEAFLLRRDLDPASMALAQQVLAVGLARSGKLGEAATVYKAYLRGARFQSPFRALDFAAALTAQARIAGDLATSRNLYERLAATFPLHQQVGEIVEARLARQELIGQPTPPLSARDLEGRRLAADEFRGKVLLVDFWATNCGPCLAEFPNLKQLYRKYNRQGFEIVGVSFDESPRIVEAFRERARLPWRMVMNQSPEGTLSRAYRTETIPALFLVDRKGNIAEVDVRGHDLRRVVEKLVQADP